MVEQVDAEGRPTSVVNRYPTPAAALLTALRAGRIAPRGSRRRRWLAHLLGRWGRVHAGSLHSSFSVGSGNDRHFQLSECWPSASLVSIDTVFLKSVGGFDESYFLYWEDVDLARRLAAAASESTVRMVATPPVVHLVGGSVSDAATHIAVRHQRWRSAHRYAASQPGARWRLVTATLSIGSVLTRRGTGALFQTARAGTPRSPATAKQPRKVVVRPVVAVVHATRRASGETRRLAGWLDLLEAAGYDPEPVALLGIRSGDARQVGGRDLGQEAGSGARQYSWPGWRAFGEVVSGEATPETLVWNHRQATKRLEEINAHTVICVTLRAFSPEWKTRQWPLILDLVDPLSDSYRQRSYLARSAWRRTGFAILARAATRTESRSTRRTVTVTAGWADARRLGVTWIPITVPATALAASGAATGTETGESPRWHALFIGSLDYPPNIDAIERLATSIWPLVRAQLPEALLGVAGRRPAPAVLAAVRQPGVELIGEFRDLADLDPGPRWQLAPCDKPRDFR